MRSSKMQSLLDVNKQFESEHNAKAALLDCFMLKTVQQELSPHPAAPQTCLASRSQTLML